MFSDDFQDIVFQLVSNGFIHSTVSCLLNNLCSEQNYKKNVLKHCLESLNNFRLTKKEPLL